MSEPELVARPSQSVRHLLQAGGVKLTISTAVPSASGGPPPVGGVRVLPWLLWSCSWILGHRMCDWLDNSDICGRADKRPSPVCRTKLAVTLQQRLALKTPAPLAPVAVESLITKHVSRLKWSGALFLLIPLLVYALCAFHRFTPRTDTTNALIFCLKCASVKL